ncbi:TetR/AcrR family transcriptional regulator C-terminal domain-containing protein [Rhodococcus sp. IEGM 1409]|uniref:TetR/AcrR family transcriptional regulator C-terminal domain-containing protein n=1 Tax=Rhodococcus sp. IEGM 1409 TaxID=3047082 RepID=UPI0024B78E3E|nr:TetR/AcrR family transcriptional regulator C-terminal domain-containing protein [Rhodococcus sp. IEGM 1409]MDI9900706.1 TetR/AcrR family transcriptional regulator C-terminal domain-containing protein [Rhodococcus sp. IEGM 1409]
MQLRRGDVLDGAMAILDEFGLADLTMRRLATSLGVQPGALYWHFPNKQTLLGAVVDKILEDLDAPVDAETWQEAYSELAHRLRSALLAHRDGAELVSATFASRMTNSKVREHFVQAGQESGLSREHAQLAAYALLYYVLGHTVDEQSRAQMEEMGALTRAPISPDSPEVIGSGSDEDLLDGDPTVRFQFGLDLFIDGIRTRLNSTLNSTHTESALRHS